MRLEIREGFCAPDGPLLAVRERPTWQRMSKRRVGELVDELRRVAEHHPGVQCIEAWRASEASGQPVHVIGLWP